MKVFEFVTALCAFVMLVFSIYLVLCSPTLIPQVWGVIGIFFCIFGMAYIYRN